MDQISNGKYLNGTHTCPYHVIDPIVAEPLFAQRSEGALHGAEATRVSGVSGYPGTEGRHTACWRKEKGVAPLCIPGYAYAYRAGKYFPSFILGTPGMHRSSYAYVALR